MCFKIYLCLSLLTYVCVQMQGGVLRSGGGAGGGLGVGMGESYELVALTSGGERRKPLYVVGAFALLLLLGTTVLLFGSVSFPSSSDNDEDHVYLDVRHLAPELVLLRFPTIAAFCAKHGLDITTELIPVAPAAHYMTGGVVTDLHGRTSDKKLFEIEEATVRERV